MGWAGRSPYPTRQAHPVLSPWWDSPEHASWVRPASVLDLGAKAVHKCSQRVTAPRQLSLLQRKQFNFLKMEPQEPFKVFPARAVLGTQEAPPSRD